MRLWGVLGCVTVLLAAAFGVSAGDTSKKFKGDFDAFFRKLDSNMDGRLSKDEFLRMADRAKERDQARQKLSQAYDQLDPEMRGLTKDVFRRFLENGRIAEAPKKTN
jgi:EF hand domain-containing protein